MDGEARFMGVRKTGRTGGWTRIRNGIQRRKRRLLGRRKCGFLGGKKELAGYIVVVFYFCCANNYVMVGFVFCLELGLIEG